MDQSPPRVDPGAAIERLPVGGAHIWIAFLAAVVVFLDGLDAQSMGYVAPALSKAWSLKPGALGPVFSASLVGIMLGALCGGPVADRIGRRRVILWSLVLFGALSLATAFVTEMAPLLALRLLTGLGLGAAMPNAIALVSEYSPKRRRAVMVMTMFCGFSLGAAIGGIVASQVVPRYGWTSMFWIGGIAPLVFLPLLVWALPESVRFLTLRDPDDRRIAPQLRRLGADVPDGARFVIAEEPSRGFKVAQLFYARRALPTVLLWIVFFMSLLDLYFLASWLPTIVNGMGFPVSLAIFLGALLQVGGTIAPPLIGWTIDKTNFFAVMTVVYVAAAAAIAALGTIGPTPLLLGIAIFVAGFCVIGGQGSANALSSALYPTVVRGTGVGWALGIGRIGSIIGPLLGAEMLSRHLDHPTIFLLGAIPAAIAAVAALALWIMRPALQDARSQHDQ